jgi:nicotinamide-nucleotide amidase
MQIALLLIGDEILSGEREDLNAHFLIEKLKSKNRKLSELLVVPDTLNRIENGILHLIKQNDFIITSGGLGLTPDDKTLQAISNALHLKLLKDNEVKNIVKSSLQRLHVNVKPYIVEEFSKKIETAEIFPNKVGVAPCQHIRTPEYSIFILPGVPDEFKFFVENIVFKYISENKSEKTEAFLINGRESDFADILNEIENKFNVKTASYPPLKNKEKYVKVKITGSEIEKAVKFFVSHLQERGIKIEERISS